jgi:hypothetical protein
VLDYLGRATAKVHCVADADSDQTLVPFQTEDAIAAVIDDREAEFVDWLTTFAREYAAVVRDDHRLFVDAFRNNEIPGVDSTTASAPVSGPRSQQADRLPDARDGEMSAWPHQGAEAAALAPYMGRWIYGALDRPGRP